MRYLAFALIALSLLSAGCGPARTPNVVPATMPPEGVIATPPHATPTSAGLLLHWESKDCRVLESDGQNLSYGRCDGKATQVPASPTDQLRLNQWQLLYEPFEASVAGSSEMQIKFDGQGTVRPGEAEQRAMAEWASLRYDELESGRTGAAWSMALDWNRSGGIAGFCDEVTVFLTGDYMVSNCKNAIPTPSASLEPSLPPHLSPEELAQLYGWYDTLQTFDYEHTDPAVADAMTIRFTFNGNGKLPASDQDIQDINAFASGLAMQSGQSAIPQAALAAEEALAKSLGIPTSQIMIVSVTAVDWPDSCLGVQTRDIMCAQVVTPGYRVVLQANGKEYTYDTDLTGAVVVQAP